MTSKRKTTERKERRLKGGRHRLRTNVDHTKKNKRNRYADRPVSTTYGEFDMQAALALAMRLNGADNPNVDDVVQDAFWLWLRGKEEKREVSVLSCVHYANLKYHRRERNQQRIMRQAALREERGTSTLLPLKLLTIDLRPELRQLAKLLASGANGQQCADLLGMNKMTISRLKSELAESLVGMFADDEPTETPNAPITPSLPIPPACEPIDGIESTAFVGALTPPHGPLGERFALPMVTEEHWTARLSPPTPSERNTTYYYVDRLNGGEGKIERDGRLPG